MTQEEKISLLEKIRLDYAFLGTPSFDVLTNAIDALKGPWVKTADRLPTEVDADFEGAVLVSQKSYDDYEDYKIAIVHWETVVNFLEDFEFWSSIPPLPKKRAEE